MASTDHSDDPGTGAADLTDPPGGWNVTHVATTASTNTDLLARADSAPDRTVLRTDHQTAGRGRLDRRWDAPPGTNLLVSILFQHVPPNPTELTHRVGLAIVDAARAIPGWEADLDISLKWPNDVVVGDAKLAGILAQRAANGAVVVGAGVNLGWAPDGAASLGPIEPADFLGTVLSAYDALPADIADRYRATLSTLGRRVRVERAGDDVVGTALDVDDVGRLIVVDECAISHHFDVGDVVHLRPG